MKLFARERRPFTANCPAEPTPAPTPGPATFPIVWGGGATPGNTNASSSKVRIKVVDPSGRSWTSFVNDPLRRASVRFISTLMSVSLEPGAGVGDDDGERGSSGTGTGTT